MASRNKSLVARIKLALHPKGPNPIPVRLDGQRIQKPAEMHLQTQAYQILGNSLSVRNAHFGNGVEQRQIFLDIVKLQGPAKEIDRMEKFHSEGCGETRVWRGLPNSSMVSGFI